MKNWLVGLAIVGLLIAHQDYWQWDRDELVFGFVPFNMAYHVGVSLATAVVWVVVCMAFWPNDTETESNSSGSERA